MKLGDHIVQVIVRGGHRRRRCFRFLSDLFADTDKQGTTSDMNGNTIQVMLKYEYIS